MGGIIRSVFGGSSSKQKSQSQSTQESGNLFADQINNTYSPVSQYTGQGANAIARLLGLNGAVDQTEAQNAFRNTPGYQFALNEGSNGVLSKFAGMGALNSGAAMKALSKYTTGLADQTYGNFMERLLGLTNVGTQAGQLIGQAGQYSKGQSTSTSSGSSSQNSGGLGKAIGAGLALLSDRRLKKDIEKIDDYNGLGVYSYHYKWEPSTAPKHEGLMAQEVELLNPEAVFTLNGWKVVDYSKFN